MHPGRELTTCLDIAEALLRTREMRNMALAAGDKSSHVVKEEATETSRERDAEQPPARCVPMDASV